MTKVLIGFSRLFFALALIIIFTPGYALPKQSDVLRNTVVDKNRQTEKADEKELEAKELSKIWEGESVRRAINLYLEAAELRENLGEETKSAGYLREASRLGLITGEAENSYTFLEKALKLEDSAQNVAGKAETLGLQSFVALQLGKVEKSRQLFESGLDLITKIDDPTAKAVVLSSAGEYYYEQRETAKAIGYYDQALKLWQKASNSSGEAQTLVLLSYVYMAHNEPMTGLELAQKALIIWQESGDKRGQAITYIAIGHMYVALDEKQSALISYQKAESLFPPDIDNKEKAMLYGGISSVYQDYGALQQASIYIKKALEIYRNEKQIHGQFYVLRVLGILSYSDQEFGAALDYFNQAEKLAQQIGEFDLAAVWQELGNLYFIKGEDENALIYYQKAVKIMDRSNYKRGVASIEEKFGRIYQRQGKTQHARRNYLAALKINRSIKSKFAEAETLFHLAGLDASLGQTDSAIRLIEESLNLTESLRGDVINSKMRRMYLAQAYDRYELYINLLMQMHERYPSQNFDVRALQVNERARARTLIENLRLSGVSFTEGVDQKLRQREQEVRSKINIKADALTDLLSGNSDQQQVNRLNREVEILTAEYQEIKHQLHLTNARFAQLDQTTEFNAQKFQTEIIDEQTLLLEFSLGQERSFLWIVGKDEITAVSLPPAAQLEERINRLIEYLGERGRTHAGEEMEDYWQRINLADAGYEREAEELSDILIKPVREKIKGKKLLIVPDGSLHYFPLAALPLEGKPLIFENEVIYQPSASALLFLNQTTQPKISDAKTMLVFADPVFSKADERLSINKLAITKSNASQPTPLKAEADGMASRLRSFDPNDFANMLPRLPASQKEAAAIAELAGPSQTTILTGTAANRQNVFEKETENYRIIHFATHGLLNKENPEFSGIVLSLFDENGERRDNGFLNLNDIYNLNLSTDLVVLSACSSGSGKEIRGEGLMSLTRGFLQAGSRSVVSSMWKVDDQATAQLMEYFYQGLLKDDLTSSEALRRAQIKMWQDPQWRAPFYWAAFNLQGEYRKTMPVKDQWSFSSSAFFTLAISTAIILLTGFLYFRKICRKNV